MHEVILGIDFLKECGSKLVCGAVEILLLSVLQVCIEHATRTSEGEFAVTDYRLLPPISPMFVSVKSSRMSTFSSSVAFVEPGLNTTKKNIFVPPALVLL